MSQEKTVIDNLEIDDVWVQSFKYLEVVIDGENSNEEEIKARIEAGKTKFYANKKLLQNKILCKDNKIKIYNTLIKPVVFEVWVLKNRLSRNY